MARTRWSRRSERITVAILTSAVDPVILTLADSLAGQLMRDLRCGFIAYLPVLDPPRLVTLDDGRYSLRPAAPGAALLDLEPPHGRGQEMVVVAG